MVNSEWVHAGCSSGAVLNARVMAAGESWRSLGVVGGGARHAAYASLASRLQTFSRWPADRPQDPKALAEAGFYYTGIDDQVQSFYRVGKIEALTVTSVVKHDVMLGVKRL